MGKTAGQVVINLSAGTSKFVQDLEGAKAKVRQFGAEGSASFKEFGTHSVSNMQATSGALRVMEGNMTNNLRAAERFVASLPGVGAALRMAFPVVGAIALGGIVTELGKKVYDFFKTLEEAPAKVASAFAELNTPLKTTNDELQLANDRLANDIAKLEGKRTNTLKIALDEAVVSADKLAESLNKDLDALNKLLKENQLGSFKAWLTGQKSTSGDEEEVKKFTDHLSEVDRAGLESVRAAKEGPGTEKQKQSAVDAAQAEWNRRAVSGLNEEISKYEQLLSESKKLQSYHEGKNQAPSYQQYVKNPTAYAPYGAQEKTPDQTIDLKTRQGILDNLKGLRDKYSLTTTNIAETRKKGDLENAAANAKMGLPFSDRMKLMREELDSVAAKMNAIGKSESEQVIAKAFGDAHKAILEVNKALQEHHTKLTAAQEGQIKTAALAIATVEAEAKWKEKLDSTTDSLTDQIRSQNLLTVAIGRGYDAVKAANVETRLMAAVGHGQYNDPDWMAQHKPDVEGLRTKISSEYDAQHSASVAKAIDLLNDPIKLEQALATVQRNGAEAVRAATFALRLEKMAEDGATKEQLKSERELYEAQRRNASAETVARLTEQTAAVRRLTAATMLGTEAQRQAAVQNKLREAQREGLTGVGPTKEALAIGTAIVDESQAEHERQIAESAVRSTGEYRNRLSAIRETRNDLKEIQATQGSSLEIEIGLRNLENERLQILVEQRLAVGTLKDGWQAFWIQMQEQAEKPGQILFMGMNSAVEGISDNLSKLMSGQKTGWAETFKQIGGEMEKSSIKSILQTGLGSVGRRLGLDIGGKKRDGQSAQSAIWVRTSDAATKSTPASGATGAPAPTSGLGGVLQRALGLGKGGGIFSGDQGGGIFNLSRSKPEFNGDIGPAERPQIQRQIPELKRRTIEAPVQAATTEVETQDASAPEPAARPPETPSPAPPRVQVSIPESDSKLPDLLRRMLGFHRRSTETLEDGIWPPKLPARKPEERPISVASPFTGKPDGTELYPFFIVSESFGRAPLTNQVRIPQTEFGISGILTGLISSRKRSDRDIEAGVIPPLQRRGADEAERRADLSRLISGKPDGTEPNPFYVVPIGGQFTNGKPSTAPAKSGSAWGSIIGNLIGAAAGVFGGKATSGAPTESVTSSISYEGAREAGGPMSAGSAYWVGEHGPEMVVPSSSGTVIPHDSGHAGSVHIGNIDARGATDPLIYQRIQEAVFLGYKASVTTAVQANVERGRRVPASA